MFVGMGLSAIAPVLDGLKTYGQQRMMKQIGLFWLVLQGVLYITGAGLYAVSGLAFALNRYTSFRTDMVLTCEHSCAAQNDWHPGDLM
jgi:predicted membrane channel-forming protein YqfA (hemolysin III family)